MKKILLLAMCFSTLTFAYACSDDKKGDTGDGGGELPQLDIDNLRQAPFSFGAAVAINPLKNDAQYRTILATEFSSITAENAMKMRKISKSKASYDFEDADYIVDFAQTNNMRVHGHVLLWYKENPDWLSIYAGDKNDWIALMEEYITDVVTHFGDKVASWDVVNEVFEDDGTYRSNNIWLQKIGPEYIALAFRAAHAANPNALLFYNEYGQEYNHAKHVAINKLIDELLEDDVPIHGVGLQMHTDIEKLEDRIKYAIRAVASRGLYVHVSELDVKVNPGENPAVTFTEELALKQQDIYRWVAQGVNEAPDDLQFGITMWGVTDQYSWLYDRPDWVLPFGDDYKRKPAYTGILQGLYK